MRRILSPARPSSPVTGGDAGPRRAHDTPLRREPLPGPRSRCPPGPSGAAATTHSETGGPDGFRQLRGILGDGPHSQSPRGVGSGCPATGLRLGEGAWLGEWGEQVRKQDLEVTCQSRRKLPFLQFLYSYLDLEEREHHKANDKKQE